MPRAVDRFNIEAEGDPTRSGTEIHTAQMMQSAAEILAGLIDDFIDDIKDQLVDFIKGLTGLDFSSLEALLMSVIQVIQNGGEFIEDIVRSIFNIVNTLDDLPVIGPIFAEIGILVDALQGIDLTSGPGAVLEAIIRAVTDALDDIPVIGDIVELIEGIVLGGGTDLGFPYTFPFTFGGINTNPVVAFFDNFRRFFDFTNFASPSFDIGDAWEGFLNLTPIGQFILTVQQKVQQVINVAWEALVDDDSGAIDRTAYDLANALKNIPVLNVVGYGAATLVDTFTDILDNIWKGFTRGHGSGKSIADVASAATDTATKADTSLQLGEWNNAVLGLRNNKTLMSGIDETEESTFLISDLYSGSTEPSSFAATSASSPMAFWRATETAKKGFISWLGKGFANISALYIDIYRFDYTAGQLVKVHTSPNQVGQVTENWGYLVYNIANEADRIDVNAGDVLGIALRVVGTGTHAVAGKMMAVPAHPTQVPARLAATRTDGLSTNLSFSALAAIYSANVPWFGIGILTGDAPPNFFAPRTTAYTETGTFTYLIPDWSNTIDVILCGGGGGACGGNPLVTIATGNGGDAGEWQGETLIRGVDFPTDATELTITVGARGAGGPGNTPGQPGQPSIRAAVPTGKAALVADGGAAGTGQGVRGYGLSAGNFTYNDVTYFGGNGGSNGAVRNGQPGMAPGGGGAGGAGGGWGVAWAGGPGGRGSAWVVARQT